MAEPSAALVPQLVQELVGYTPELRALARSIAVHEDPEDLVQDTVVTALTAVSRPRALGPWLRQVLRNRRYELARTEVRRRARERITAVDRTGFDDPLLRRELLQAVCEALDQLDEPYRAVLRMRFFEGRSALDIAAASGCPEGTVRWRTHEGLDRIRRRLDERYGKRQWFGALLAVAGPPPTATAMQGVGSMKTIVLSVTVAALAAGGAVATMKTGGEVRTTAEADDSSPRSPVATATTRPTSDLAEVWHDRAMLAPSSSEKDAGEPVCDAETCAGPPDVPVIGQGFDELFTGCGVLAADVASLMPEFEFEVRIRKQEPGDSASVEAVQVIRDDSGIAGLGQCLATALRENIAFGMLDADVGDEQVLRLQLGSGAEVPPPTEPRSFELAGVARKGPSDAPITLIECSDFDCPFCGKVNATIEDLLDANPDIAVHYLNNPLPGHAHARLKARAALAAQAQGKFWDMHDALFEAPGAVDEDGLVELAGAIGIDEERFEAALHDPALDAEIDRQIEMCKNNGAIATPTFFVNGRTVRGAQPLEAFQAAVDAARQP